jgi:hypothetical protein
MITQQTIITRKEQAFATELGDELVIMDIEAGNYITLNKLGKVIWDLLEKPHSINELVGKLLERFEVEEVQCRTETLSFIDELEKNKLIDITLV